MTDTNDTQNYTAEIEEDGNEITITAEIPQDTLEDYKEAAHKSLQNEVSLDGFRDGEVPQDALEKEVGEMAILQETAQHAIQDIYPQIIADNQLQAIGRPDIKITKMSPGEPVGFTAEITTMPEVTLPDNYKEVAREAAKKADEENDGDQSDEVSDDEVDEAIDNIRRQMAQAQKREQAGEDADPSELNVDEGDLPELTDQFVQQISEEDTVEDFRDTVRSNLSQQQERKSEEAKRGKIIDTVVDGASAELPDLVVEGELDKMMAQFESDIQRSGMESDEYFDDADTTREQMREKWRPDAQRRAKTQLVLNKIAAEEDIQLDEGAVDEQVDELMENYEDVTEARARTFVRSRMLNDKTINFLESLSEDQG
jgi:trigger factor